MATNAPGRKGQGSRPAAVSRNKPTSGVKTTHPPGTQPLPTTPGSSSGRSSTSPAATFHAATTSQELTWATVQSVRAQLGASHPIAVEVARLYSEQEKSKGSSGPPKAEEQHMPMEGAVDLGAVTEKASILRSQKQHSQAATLLLGALTAAESALPPEHPTVVCLVYCLALTLHESACCEKALQYWQRLLPHCSVLAAAINVDEPLLRTHLSAANCLEHLGRYAEARAMYHAAWDLARRRPDNTDLLGSELLRDLLCCYSKSRSTPTKEFVTEALLAATSTSARCTIDISRLSWLQVQAMCQQKLGQYEAADRSYSTLLPLAKRVLGADSDTVRALLYERSLCLPHLQQGAKAQSLHLHNVQTAKRQYGADHPTTLEAVVALAYIYQADNKPLDCVRVCEEAWEPAFRMLGPDHQHTRALVLMRMGALTKLGREQEALQVVAEARRRGVSDDELTADVRRGEEIKRLCGG